MPLTRDANKLLSLMYKEYKKRLHNGKSRKEAKSFGGDILVQKDIMPKESLENIQDYLWELHRNGFVAANKLGNGGVYLCWLTDEAIAAMENRPKRIFKSVTDFVTNFIP